MKILYADDSPISWIGVSKILRDQGYQDASHALTLSHTIDSLKAEKPDVLITEVRFADSELFENATEVLQAHPEVRIIVYTFHDNPTYVARAVAAKLFDFVLKHSDPSYLLRTLASVHSDSPPRESLLLKTKIFLTQTHHLTNALAGHLTKREIQILTHLGLGLSNREISNTLGISLETVKEHVQNVLRKIKAKDRTEAAVWALRNGIPTLDLKPYTTAGQLESA